MKKILFYIMNFILIPVLVITDQVTKQLALKNLNGKPPVDIIKNVLQLTYLRNDGAAWGMFSGKQWFFIVLTVVLMVLIMYILIKMPFTRKYLPLRIIIETLMAGALGNFIDRVANGYVHDFIYFKIIDFPVFNFADICVSLSMIALVIMILFKFKDTDFEFFKIHKSKKEDNYYMDNMDFEDIINLTTDENNSGERIDKFLSDMLSSYSRSYVQKLISDRLVLVDNKNIKSNYKLRAGDAITIYIPVPRELEVTPENIPLDIIYEDDDIIVINKPKGMVVHPSAGHYTGTLVNALMYHCKDHLSAINGILRPGIVHRIDMDTTGVIVACKNDAAHISISEQLKEHSITRHYYAICTIHSR